MENHPKVSVIIPARNEETMIGRALESIQNGGVPAHEVIVVINGTTDSTAEIARKMYAKVICFEKALGYSGARNEGASRASGNILVFMDADSLMGPNVLLAITQSSAEPKVFGTVLGGADNAKIRYKIFFLIKNTAHRLGFYRGVLGGLFFCETELFKSAGGYDNSLAINENADIVQHLLKRGGKYKLLTNVFAYTSMRRFEEHGMWRALLFWCMVKLRWFIKSKRSKIGNQYAMTHDKFYSSR